MSPTPRFAGMIIQPPRLPSVKLNFQIALPSVPLVYLAVTFTENAVSWTCITGNSHPTDVMCWRRGTSTTYANVVFYPVAFFDTHRRLVKRMRVRVRLKLKLLGIPGLCGGDFHFASNKP